MSTPIKYKIMSEEGPKQVSGYFGFSFAGLAFGIHRSAEGWNVSELSTGRKAGYIMSTFGKTKLAAERYLKRAGVTKVYEEVSRHKAINPEYQMIT